MLDLCGVDPVPTLKLVFAEMALACNALSDAIQHAGSPQVANSLLRNRRTYEGYVKIKSQEQPRSFSIFQCQDGT